MKRVALVVSVLLAWGAAKLPAERAFFTRRAQQHLVSIPLTLDLASRWGSSGLSPR
jgi:hypothetical protein